jgi:hypothetical protein
VAQSLIPLLKGLKISLYYCYSSAVGIFRRSSLIKVSYCRGLVLLLALLLACTANLMCISCDPDHNEQTPPLHVDFSFVVRGHSGIHAPRFVPQTPTPSFASSENLIAKYPIIVLQHSYLDIAAAPYANITLPLLC